MAEIKMTMGKKPKSNRHLGNLNITTADIPNAKDWNIGDKVKVMVEIEVTGIRKPDKWETEDDGVTEKSIMISSEIKTIKADNAKKE